MCQSRRGLWWRLLVFHRYARWTLHILAVLLTTCYPGCAALCPFFALSIATFQACGKLSTAEYHIQVLFSFGLVLCFSILPFSEIRGVFFLCRKLHNEFLTLKMLRMMRGLSISNVDGFYQLIELWNESGECLTHNRPFWNFAKTYWGSSCLFRVMEFFFLKAELFILYFRKICTAVFRISSDIMCS